LGTEKALSGIRVDTEGNPVAPKVIHQNGKGIKQPKKTAGGGGTKIPTTLQGTAEKNQAAGAPLAAKAPQSAMAAAIAAATAAKSDN
jgi:hypothetical protein